MITPAQAMAFFSLTDEAEAKQTFETVKEILIERGLVKPDDAPKLGRPRGSRNHAKSQPLLEDVISIKDALHEALAVAKDHRGKVGIE